VRIPSSRLASASWPTLDRLTVDRGGIAVVLLPMGALPIRVLATSIVLFRLPSIEAEPVVAVPTPPG